MLVRRVGLTAAASLLDVWPPEPETDGDGHYGTVQRTLSRTAPVEVHRIEPASAVVVLATEPGGLTRFLF